MTITRHCRVTAQLQSRFAAEDRLTDLANLAARQAPRRFCCPQAREDWLAEQASDYRETNDELSTDEAFEFFRETLSELV